jgi:hypothetical protein
MNDSTDDSAEEEYGQREPQLNWYQLWLGEFTSDAAEE